MNSKSGHINKYGEISLGRNIETKAMTVEDVRTFLKKLQLEKSKGGLDLFNENKRNQSYYDEDVSKVPEEGYRMFFLKSLGKENSIGEVKSGNKTKKQDSPKIINYSIKNDPLAIYRVGA